MRRILVAVLLVALFSESSAMAARRRRAVRHPASPAAAPVAAADSYSVSQGVILTVDAPGVLANDTLGGGAIASFGASSGAEETILGNSVATARGGTLTLSASGGFVYVPSPSFAGADAFHYILRNDGGTSSAVVTIDVVPQLAAVADAYSTEPERSLFVPAPGVLTNDMLAGGANIVAFGPTQGTETAVDGTGATASGGTISLNADGSFRYIPPSPEDDGYGYPRPFFGLDGFVYTIRGGTVSSAAAVSVAVEVPAAGADYVVTTPGHYYAISGLTGENPVLQLTRGKTYKFRISASELHPFAILDAPPGSVTNNNITSGIVTFTVPAAAQNYRYRCTTHGFGNAITTVP